MSLERRRTIVMKLVALLLFVPLVAHADADRDFRAWVRARAARQQVGIAQWGTVQLDEDPGRERFAVLCNQLDETATILIEKSGTARWSFTRDVDGRNDCAPDGTPHWEALREPGFTVDTNYHHGQTSNTIALRNGAPIVVAMYEIETNIPHDCSEEHIDFDRLVREETHCIPKTFHKEDMDHSPATHAAVFVLDGPSGTYRSRVGTGDAPALDVKTITAGKRADVAVTLSRSALVGETVEAFSTSASREPTGWAQRWSGTSWIQSGVGHAPRELPGARGDASHLTVPVLRRDLDGGPGPVPSSGQVSLRQRSAASSCACRSS